MISPVSVRSIKWTVRAYLFYNGYEIVIKRVAEMKTTKPSKNEGKGVHKSFLIYRYEILRLLRYCSTTTSPHDALVVELPCLQGFRNEEVSTWRHEWIDFEHEDCMVFDAKKHRLMGPIPLNRTVGRHVMAVSHGKTEGLVIENMSSAWRGRDKPLSNINNWYTWRKLCTAIDIYPSPKEYSPIVGRRFFIRSVLEARKDEPLAVVAIDLMRWVRHADIAELLNYASHIHFYEDEKMGYDKFQNSMERAMANLQTQEAKQ